MTALLPERTTSADVAELERLAEAYNNDELPTWEVHQAVDRIAHPNLTPHEAWAAFQDLADAIDDRQRLADGSADWTAIDPTLTGPNRTDAAAADIVDQRIRDTLTTLTRGDR